MMRFVKSLAPRLRKTQATNLALLSSSIIARKSLSLSELARAYPGPKRHCHRLKRLWRFLENLHVDWSSIRGSLTRLSYSVDTTPGLLLPILVDGTFFEPYEVLSASIPRGGRALPIAWHTYHRRLEGEDELSRNLIEEAFMTRCLAQITPGIQVVVIADRGFGKASFLIFLQGRKADFVVRLAAKVRVTHPDFSDLLAELPLAIGRRRWFEGVWYRQDQAVQINLLAVWQWGQTEPWYLATSLKDPKLVYALYRKRMKIEHGFRDWKHHLRLKIPSSRLVRSSQRAAMLVNAIVLAYWLLCLVGLKALPKGYQRQVTSWGKASFFRLALELVTSGPSPGAIPKMLAWVEGKLASHHPPLTFWQHRYQLRLAQSG